MITGFLDEKYENSDRDAIEHSGRIECDRVTANKEGNLFLEKSSGEIIEVVCRKMFIESIEYVSMYKK